MGILVSISPLLVSWWSSGDMRFSLLLMYLCSGYLARTILSAVIEWLDCSNFHFIISDTVLNALQAGDSILRVEMTHLQYLSSADVVLLRIRNDVIFKLIRIWLSFSFTILPTLKRIICAMPILVHTSLLQHTPPSGHYTHLLDCILTFIS